MYKVLLNSENNILEFEDKKWLPDFLRNAMTGVLGVAERWLGIYDPLAAEITHQFPDKNITIVDLCSGSGEGISSVANRIAVAGRNLTLILTDLYPNKKSALSLEKKYSWINYPLKSLDAINVPDLFPADIYTILAGFHHFSEEGKIQLIKNATRDHSVFLIAEGARSNILSWIFAAIFLPFLTWASVPFIRPFDIKWVPFTYIIPLIPFLVWWDGLNSLAAIKSSSKLRDDLKESLPGYQIVTGESSRGPGITLHWLFVKASRKRPGN